MKPQEHDRIVLADLPDGVRKMLEVLDVDGDGYVSSLYPPKVPLFREIPD